MKTYHKKLISFLLKMCSICPLQILNFPDPMSPFKQMAHLVFPSKVSLLLHCITGKLRKDRKFTVWYTNGFKLKSKSSIRYSNILETHLWTFKYWWNNEMCSALKSNGKVDKLDERKQQNYQNVVVDFCPLTYSWISREISGRMRLSGNLDSHCRASLGRRVCQSAVSNRGVEM